MISGLIDELNKSADEWNSSNMFELARMCRDAADTIWELRDDLQRANADNDKLRKLAQRMWRLERFGCYGCRWECDAESCYASDCKEAVGIEQEMRELGIEVPQ